MNAIPMNDVEQAYQRILKWVRITPIIRMQGPGARPVILKLEGSNVLVPSRA